MAKRKPKIDTTKNVLFRNRLTTDRLTNADGIGFEVRALKHKEFAFMEANSTTEIQKTYWIFRMGVVSFINMKDEAGKSVELFQEEFKDPIGGNIKYMGEAQFENLDVGVVGAIATAIANLSKINLEDLKKLNFTSASKNASA